MLTPLKQGGTKLDHLRQVAKKKGTDVIPELEIPESGQHVWDWFMVLYKRRSGTGLGPAPLLFAEIKAWKELTGIIIAPWEIMAIMAMDDAYLETVSKLREK